MSATILFGDVLRMMRVCAAGSTWRLANHSRVFTYNDMVYRSFPKHNDIELGHIRKMARFFRILDCARLELPALK